MLKIGLTGGIGSGKSTVSAYIKQKGIPVIDADQISHTVINLYPKLKEEIRNVFGEGFFDEEGKLKRQELGNFIFQETERRVRLEQIMIPYIESEIFKQMKEKEQQGNAFVVLDAPTLIEQNFHKVMDYTIVVWVDLKTQIQRVKERDGLSNEQIRNRIKAQLSLEKKKEVATYTIDNGGTMENTKKQIEELILQIEMKQEGK